MSMIIDWGNGNAYQNMTDEAKELRRQYLQFCDECSKAHDFTCSGADAKACKEKKDELLKMMLDICDTRRFCVVTNNDEYIPCVRHIFRVSEKADLEGIKKEYYAAYSQNTADEFFIFTGLHNAQNFAEKWQDTH